MKSWNGIETNSNNSERFPSVFPSVTAQCTDLESNKNSPKYISQLQELSDGERRPLYMGNIFRDKVNKKVILRTILTSYERDVEDP